MKRQLVVRASAKPSSAGQGIVEYGLILTLTVVLTGIILGVFGGVMADVLAAIGSAIDSVGTGG